MCDNAWAWAKERGLWRTNPVHKEEECKLVITDEFKYNVHQSHASEQSGTFEMQVGLCSIYATFSYIRHPSPVVLPAFQPVSSPHLARILMAHFFKMILFQREWKNWSPISTPLQMLQPKTARLAIPLSSSNVLGFLVIIGISFDFFRTLIRSH